MNIPTMIIHCPSCRWCKKNEDGDGITYRCHYFGAGAYSSFVVSARDYCAYGEEDWWY